MVKVTKIDADPKLSQEVYIHPESKRLRVVAYARVSTMFDEQEGSYEAQIRYYTEYIKSNPNWVFAGIYADKGITGTNRKKREGFNLMMENAKSGKFDLILTKSISRFARNTADSLTAIRELKGYGVGIFFEKENINSLDSKGELLITIMSSIAQEESRSISENVSWGKRKRMAEGKISCPWSRFLGYTKDKAGNIQIVEKEAEIVRKIFKLYLECNSLREVADILNSEGIRTVNNKKWTNQAIRVILMNEKYIGDALLQKNYTVDFLTKKIRKNKGELPQYYVENSHPAIIQRNVFFQVQKELGVRIKGKRSKVRVLDGMVHCSLCGAVYIRRIWHSNTKYKKIAWECSNKYNKAHKCHASSIGEAELISMLQDIARYIYKNKPQLIQSAEDKQHETSKEDIQNKLDKAKQDRDISYEKLEKLTETADNLLTPGTNLYIRDDTEVLKANSIYKEDIAKVEALEKELFKIEVQEARTEAFIDFLKHGKNIQRSKSNIENISWLKVLKDVTINKNNTVTFTFQNNQTITIPRQQRKRRRG